MDNGELKAGFERLRTVVRESLNESDPIGLLRLGAPDDEYAPEVGTVVPRLREAACAEDVRTILLEEFSHWFGPEAAGSAEQYAAPAQRIWTFLESDGAC